MADSHGQESLDGRRSFSRLQVGIGARLDTLEGSQPVRLIDLSQGGAHVILSRPEDDLRAAVLTWLRFETFGEVVWHEDEHVGLKFDRLLPLGCLVETRQRAPSVVSEEAAEMAQAWASGTLADY